MGAAAWVKIWLGWGAETGALARPMASTGTEARCRRDGEDFCFNSVMRCLRRMVRCGVSRPVFDAVDVWSEPAEGVMSTEIAVCWCVRAAWDVCGRGCRGGESRTIGGATDMALEGFEDTGSCDDDGRVREAERNRGRVKECVEEGDGGADDSDGVLK